MTEKITYKWEIEFQIVPSLNKSETVENYNFEVRNNDTFVRYNYETYSERKGYEEGYEHKKKIKELMLQRMIYKKFFGSVDINIISGPTLLNEEELTKAGLLDKSTRTVTITKGLSYDVFISLNDSHNFWKSGFKGRIVGLESEILRIAEWFQKAEIEEDTINSFISAWIAFNGLYNLFYSITINKDAKDPVKFEYIVKELLKNGECDKIIYNNKEILDDFETYDILSDSKNSNWSTYLKIERKKLNIDSIEIIRLVVRCIYRVRKEVFHEAPRPKDIDNRVKNCKSILMPIALECLKNFIMFK